MGADGNDGRSSSLDIQTSPPIPAVIVIGVTGHREIPSSGIVISRIGEAIRRIRELLPPLYHTPIAFTALSSLAEGADRFLAAEILKIPHSRLKAVLPLESDDYLRDFKSRESKDEFRRLLGEAEEIKTLPRVPERSEAYRRAGRYIVDHCDVLIAVWDGEKGRGRGGTGDIVQYAKEKKCPFLWIRLDSQGGIEFEPGRGLSREAFLELDQSNAERIPTGKYRGQSA